MNIKSPQLLSLIAVVGLASCAKPVISNLQKGTYQYTTTDKKLVGVLVGVTPIPKPADDTEKPKTFFDLRDSLPHIFLKEISRKVNHPDSLIKYLSRPLSDVPKKPAEKKTTDYTTYKIRLNIAHWNKFYDDEGFLHPNTRMEYLTTTVSMPAGSASTFYTIDRLENEIDEIDLGTLSREQNVTFNTKLTGEYGVGGTTSNTSSGKTTNASGSQVVGKQTVYDEKGNAIGTIDNTGTSGNTRETNSSNTVTGSAAAKATGEVGYLNSQAIKEAVAMKLNRLKTGFSFSSDQLVIAQRGRPLGDITYNTFVTLTLKVSNSLNVFTPTVYDFDKLFLESGIANKAADISFSSRGVNFVPCRDAQDINLTTKYDGAIRRVEGQNEKNTGVNALEYDDKVTFVKLEETSANNVVVSKAIYCKKAYKITAKFGGDNYVLKIAAPVPEELLIFIDDKPEVFFAWLMEHLNDPKKPQLLTSKYRLYFEKVGGGRQIPVVQGALTDAQINDLKLLIDVKLEERLP